MKKTTSGVHPFPHRVPSTIGEMVRRFVHDDVVLACDLHAPSVRAFAASLTSNEECDDQILLDFDSALNCLQCSLIAASVRGAFPWGTEEMERVTTLCQAEVHSRGEDTVDRADSTADAEDRPPSSSKPISYIRDRKVLTVDPICLPDGPFCSTPVRLAAASAEGWDGILFGHEQPVRLGTKDLPVPRIEGWKYPLVVTTPYRAQLEYVKGNDWHVALPLAPQRTVIVVHRGSKLYDIENQTGFKDMALVRRLGGCALAVADKTSSYASRLVMAARHATLQEVFIPKKMLDEKRQDTHLYLIVERNYDKMIGLLEDQRIDGFATVEPAPTLAKVRLGNRCAEATMLDSCTPATSGFCCVVMTPAELVRNAEAYDALLRSLIFSICDLMRKDGLQALVTRFEATLKGLPARKYPLDPWAIATQAALNTLSHFTAHLRPHLDRPDECAELLLPEPTIEAIRAEATALAPQLRGDERRRWLRGLERLDDPKASLFDFRRAREIFREILPKDFKGEVQNLDAEIISRASS